MFTLIFRDILLGTGRFWRLYVTNTIAIVMIILLYAYIDGSRRQLNLERTAFMGEIVVTAKTPVPDMGHRLEQSLESVIFISEKITTDAQVRIPKNNVSKTCRLVGASLQTDRMLRSYITLKLGTWPKRRYELLIPSSLLQAADITVGDKILITGKTADKINTAMTGTVAGIYHSQSLTLFDAPRVLMSIQDMTEFFQPRPRDIRYGLFFKDSKIPETINHDVATLLGDKNRDIIDDIVKYGADVNDVMNISNQFNVFLVIMIVLTILVVITMVILVNFNVYTMVYRIRRLEIGTFMSLGVKPRVIAATLFLESMVQVLLCMSMALLISYGISFYCAGHTAGGLLEVLSVLLSGTDRIDFFIQGYQIKTAFAIIAGAITVAQAPVVLRIFWVHPLRMLRTS